MKNKLLILSSLIATSLSAQMTQDFESGSKSAEQSKTWQFGAGDVTSSGPISGSYSYLTNQLSNSSLSACWVKTPWAIWSSGTISMDAKLNQTGGSTYKVSFRFIPWDECAAYQEGTYTSVVYEYTMSNSTSVQSISFSVPSAVQDGKPWRMMVSYSGNGGSTRIIHDNWSVPASAAFYDADGDNIPDAMDKYPADATNNSKGAIFARAWNDLDGDGIQDACEPGLDGVTVRERSSSGSQLSAKTTAYNGYVAFFDITTGNSRKLDFDKPNSNYAYTLQDQGSDDAIDSDIGSNGETVSFTVSGVVSGVAGGFLAPGTVKAFVWDDQDGDGIQDSGEPGISGNTVKLLWASGSQIASTSTDGNGVATFTNVPAGQALKLDFDRRNSNHWFTGADAGSDDALDSDGDTASGVTSNFTLTQGSQLYEDMDMGQWAPGTVKALVWDDQDGDGVQDSGEPGISGNTVKLLWASGSQIASTSTNGNGVATFTNVPAGQAIKLDFDRRSSNHWYTGANAGSDDALDSDGDTTNGVTSTFRLYKGSQVYEDMDQGQWAPGTVTVFVFEDTDYDGVQDNTEPGISGRTVRLRWSSGSQIAAVTSDANGNATFTNVPAGRSLKLEISKPSDHIFALQNVGTNDALDSDPSYSTGYTADFRLDQGSQNYTDMDAGMINVNLDSDSDGIPNYLDKYVFDATNNNKAAILSRVWDDRDGDGIQDNSEPGIGSVTVRLRNSGGTLLQTKTTHEVAGLVAFFDLTTGSSFILDVTKPTGTIFTTLDAGTNDNVDSDIQSSNSRTVAFTASGVVLNQDAGVLMPGTINTFVWNDLDGDGIQDSGEPGISGVTVQLRNSGGTLLQTESTGSNGVATFTDVPTGVTLYLDYTRPTSGHTITQLNIGTNDNIDSDADPSTTNSGTFSLTRGSQTLNTFDCGMWAPGTVNTFVWDDQDGDGIQDNGEPGLSGREVKLRYASSTLIQTATTDANGIATFTNVPTGTNLYLDYTLPSGYTITAQNQGSDDAADSDADETSTNSDQFSLTQGSQVYTLMDCGMWAPGTVNTLVWDDQDGDGIQDNGEPGLSGREVKLRYASSTLIQTATTDANGIATFTNVPTGTNLYLDYTLPSGYTITAQNQGSNDAADSDADETSTNSDQFSLTQGSQVYTLMDCGMWAPGTVTTFVWDDLDGDGIQDSGEPGLSGREVKLRYASSTLIQTATTNSSGIATFTNVPTGTNLYLDYTVPTGNAITLQNQGSDEAADSDADQTTTNSDVFSLTQGSQNYTSMDCGMWAPGTINTYVWGDANNDGIQTLGEPALNNVMVRLRNSGGTTLATAYTNSSGIATFTNVPAGVNLYLHYYKPSSAWSFSPQDQGSDEAIDSDADGTTGYTTQFSLTSGSSTVTIYDAGLFNSSLYSGFRVVKEEKGPETQTIVNNTPEGQLKSVEKVAVESKDAKAVPTQSNIKLVGTFNVYPVPAATNVNIELNVEYNTEVQFALVDMTGRVVKNGSWQLLNGVNLNTIQVSDLPEGYYTLRVVNNNQVLSRKINVIKQ